MQQWDPAIERWLKKLDIAPGDAPTAEVFHDFLSRVDRHLKHMNGDRDLLTRTLETSTTEMQLLNDAVRAERDRLEIVMRAAADALSVFAELPASDTGSGTSDVKDRLAIARTKFATRLAEVVDDGVLDDGNTSSIRGLKQSFAVLADQITFLVEGVSDAAQMREQLEVAGAVQRMLVPEESTLQFGDMSLAARFQPATTCGGDWWTVHQLTPDRTLVVVADVTGHGVPSAIITGAAKGATDLARMATRGTLGPGMLLRMLNSVIASASRRQYMMTAVAMVIDGRQRVIMANAGHPAPLLLRDGKASAVAVLRDPPLGAATSAPFGETEVQLQPGDRLFVYTDGVTECVDPSGEEFGDRRLRALLSRCSDRGPAEIRDWVNEGLATFSDGADAADDITHVTLAAG